MAVRRPIQDSAKRAGSEFGRQIAVDLEADADFDEDRGGPSHGRFPRSLFRAHRLIQAGMAGKGTAKSSWALGTATELRSPTKEAGPLRVRLQFIGAGADNHLPEGNSCQPDDCISGRMGNRSADSLGSMPPWSAETTRRVACQPCGGRGLELRARILAALRNSRNASAGLWPPGNRGRPGRGRPT